MFPTKLPGWVIPAGIAVIVILAALALSYCVGGKGEQNKQLKREVEFQQDVGAAADNASTARVDDAVRTEQQEKELEAAQQAIAGPDERRCLRGLVILRQQGHDTSRLSCGRP